MLVGSKLEWYVLFCCGVMMTMAVFLITHGLLGGTWVDIAEYMIENVEEPARWGEGAMLMVHWMVRVLDGMAPPLVWGVMVMYTLMPGAAWLLVRMHEKWRWC